jgi:DNA-binding transcriptional ArsR family regulator
MRNCNSERKIWNLRSSGESCSKAVSLGECRDPAACDATEEGMSRCVGDLGEDLDVTPSTVSHHLKELRQAGLMHIQRRGQRIECWASEDALLLLAGFFGDAVDTRTRPRVAPRAAATGRR